MKKNKSKSSIRTSLKFFTILAVLLIIFSSSGIDVKGDATPTETKITYDTAKSELIITTNVNQPPIKISNHLWKKIQEQTTPANDGKVTGWAYNTNTNTLSNDGNAIKITGQDQSNKGTITVTQGDYTTTYVAENDKVLRVHSSTAGSPVRWESSDLKTPVPPPVSADAYNLMKSANNNEKDLNAQEVQKFLKIEGLSSVKLSEGKYITKDKKGRELEFKTSNNQIISSTTISGSKETAVKQDIIYGSDGIPTRGSVYQGSDSSKEFQL